ncbi:transposase [Streptomyces sp. NPDC048434]|uniref:transposase n=1 Tax=Streptomyces sp. NPDC048434 TaxID=3365549 RepID=UPI0037193F72
MGSKHHLICDGKGTPLHVITTSANVNDITQVRRGLDRSPRVQPSSLGAAGTEQGRSTRSCYELIVRTHKTPTQKPYFTGSRITTHST